MGVVRRAGRAVVAVEPLCVPAVLVVHLVCAVRDSAGGLVARARRAVRAAAGEDGLDVEEEAAQLLQLAPLRLTPRRHRARQRDVDGRVRHDPRLAARLVEHRGRDEGVEEVAGLDANGEARLAHDRPDLVGDGVVADGVGGTRQIGKIDLLPVRVVLPRPVPPPRVAAARDGERAQPTRGRRLGTEVGAERSSSVVVPRMATTLLYDLLLDPLSKTVQNLREIRLNGACLFCLS